uniref:COP9 signalosome complex subunit 7b-like n=1 Tax=Styela clava TaxID=7725 RepID=UPI00193A8A00|nr:COP9 signalosome complex subunit 7b-like [Styela clava]
MSEMVLKKEFVTGNSTKVTAGTFNTNQQLEQFLILAKTAKGSALKELIKQAMEARDVYFFGELLEIPAIQALEQDPTSQTYFSLLKIFAYGIFKDYLADKDTLPELTPMMTDKLRHLTVATLATKFKYLPYSTLLDELAMSNTRQLEDLLISAIYSNVIRGKLDQQNSRLEVDWTIGRDIRPADLDNITMTLESWCNACGIMLQGIQTQVKSSNIFLEEDQKRKQQIEQEVTNIRKTIKAASGQQEMELTSSDKNLSSHPMPSAGVENKPKKSKVKGLRGSQAVNKLWSSKN